MESQYKVIDVDKIDDVTWTRELIDDDVERLTCNRWLNDKVITNTAVR